MPKAVAARTATRANEVLIFAVGGCSCWKVCVKCGR